MRRIDTVLEHPDNCCGCGNCLIKCPQRCIKWERRPGGFKYPKIDLNFCIDCKICEKVCPELNIISSHENNSEVYAAYTKDSDLRKDSSSGGIFGILAKNTIEKNGVVFGAAFNEGFILHTDYAESVENLKPLYKSKYVESELNNTFFKVEKFLNEGREVLFCSTTCQCHALLKFLKNSYPNLILVDILCHGVLSQELFLKVLEYYENKKNIKIQQFIFRYKGKGMSEKTDHSFKLIGENNSGRKNISGSSYKFPYYQFYLTYQGFRKSCYNCKFATVDRPTDITLGDFWKLDRLQKCDDFRKGYSMVIIRTYRGRAVFDQVISDIEYKRYSMSEAICSNPTVSQGADPQRFNKHFIQDYEHYPISYVIKKYMNIKTDIIHRGIRYIKRLIK